MPSRSHSQHAPQRSLTRKHSLRRRPDPRPVAVFRQRHNRRPAAHDEFAAPERWHEPRADGRLRILQESPGTGYIHVVTPEEVRQRLSQLPAGLLRGLEVVQLSGMTRKRLSFPCYGMQWGSAIYLYPIEESLEESYFRPPSPQQLIEARMYGGTWINDGAKWRLRWTQEAIRDFYLNNVLIHEVGHINDSRNTRSLDRERFANWFAIEYGYRPTRNPGHDQQPLRTA